MLKHKHRHLGGTGIAYRKVFSSGESMPVELHLEALKAGAFTGHFSAINSKLITGKEAKAQVYIKESDAKE